MIRISLTPILVVLTLAVTSSALAQLDADRPITYEVLINGETFRVVGNRMTKLQSKEKPGTTYSIAIRVAPTQKVRMNALQFEYDMPAKITDDRSKTQRVVQVKHELGFSVQITDLGDKLPAKTEEDVLKVLADSLAASYKELQGATEIKVTEPREGKFDGAAGRGCNVHYQDAQGYGHTGWVWVLSGEKFSVSCVVQYLDEDGQDALPLVKRILNSLRSIEEAGK